MKDIWLTIVKSEETEVSMLQYYLYYLATRVAQLGEDTAVMIYRKMLQGLY